MLRATRARCLTWLGVALISVTPDPRLVELGSTGATLVQFLEILLPEFFFVHVNPVLLHGHD